MCVVGAVRELDVTDVVGRLYVRLVEFTALGLARPSGTGWSYGGARVLEDHALRLPY